MSYMREDAPELEHLRRQNYELIRQLAERTVERDNATRKRTLSEIARSNLELDEGLAQRTIERDEFARKEALEERARRDAELANRLAQRTVERDDFARTEANRALARSNLARLQVDLERENRASQAFQEAALPGRLPTIPGIEFNYVYRAANAETQVGGDGYDAFRLDDGRVVLSIGDVIGNGLLAAVTMGAVRQALRGAAHILADPIEILNAVDRALHSEHPDRIVTTFVGILDLVTLTLTYGSAGHPPPFLRSATGEVTELRGSGLPIGLRSFATAIDEMPLTVSLEATSLLILFTDGLTESTRDYQQGEQKVRAALQNAAVYNSSDPAASIANEVLDDIRDDVAILTVRIDSPPFSVTCSDGIVEHDARWSFATKDHVAAADVRVALVAALQRHGASESEQIVSELIFSELLGNVVRYGTETVTVALDTSIERPVLHVLDRGPGFTYTARLPTDPMSDSGRGLFIVKSLALAFNVTKRFDGGSHARAVLPISSHAERLRRRA